MKLSRIVSVTIAVVLLVLVSGVALSARGGNPLDQILAKLDAITVMLTPTLPNPLDQVDTKLDTIIGMLTPTPPAPAGLVTLITAPVNVPPTQLLECVVANDGTENVDGILEIVPFDGIPVSSRTMTLSPGQPYRTGASNLPNTGVSIHEGVVRCRFRVLEGNASSIRGTLEVYDAPMAHVMAIVEMR